jgi:hypothetical protein
MRHAPRIAGALLFVLLILSCAPKSYTDDPRNDFPPGCTSAGCEADDSGAAAFTPSSLYRTAAFVAATPSVPLNDAPVLWQLYAHGPNAGPTVFARADFAGDSLRVTVNWSNQPDSLGVQDSTVFRLRVTKAFRLANSNTVAANTWRRRRHLPGTTADTFRLAKPAVGDSIIFTADSITQCRRNMCSVPGSAAWGYHRTAAPPAMTFVRVSVDSF